MPPTPAETPLSIRNGSHVPLHRYQVSVGWTGNLGAGTTEYRSYSRDHEVAAPGKPTLHCSSDPGFRGDGARWNPEELLVAALSQCHLLWSLHLCAEAGVVVVGYADAAEGVMETGQDGGGRFRSVLLRPHVTVADATMVGRAADLHREAQAKCFIANSVNFPVDHEPTTHVEAAEAPHPGNAARTSRRSS